MTVEISPDDLCNILRLIDRVKDRHSAELRLVNLTKAEREAAFIIYEYWNHLYGDLSQQLCSFECG